MDHRTPSRTVCPWGIEPRPATALRRAACQISILYSITLRFNVLPLSYSAMRNRTKSTLFCIVGMTEIICR